MTDKTEKVITNLEGWVGNPADLTSFNTFGVVTLSDGQQVNVQITARHGIAADKMYEDFKKYIAFLDLCATDSGVKFLEKKPTIRQPADPADQAYQQEGKKKEHRYDQPVPQSELPEELAEITVDVFAQDFDYFMIEPQLDDKANVKFMTDNLEWAVGARINKWKHETVIKVLAPLDKELDPSKPAKIRVAGVQYWKTGVEYEITKGENKGKKSNYKDLLLVKPTF